MVMFYLSTSSNMVSNSMQGPSSSVTLGWKGDCRKTLSGNRTLYHATLAEPSLSCLKISSITPPNIWPSNSSDLLSHQWLCVGSIWVRYWQNSLLDQKGSEGKNNSSIYQFKQGDGWKSLQEIPKLSGGCGWSYWLFLWINFIWSIWRYFHVILVNLSDPVKCQCYFHYCII